MMREADARRFSRTMLSWPRHCLLLRASSASACMRRSVFVSVCFLAIWGSFPCLLRFCSEHVLGQYSFSQGTSWWETFRGGKRVRMRRSIFVSVCFLSRNFVKHSLYVEVCSERVLGQYSFLNNKELYAVSVCFAHGCLRVEEERELGHQRTSINHRLQTETTNRHFALSFRLAT